MKKLLLKINKARNKTAKNNKEIATNTDFSVIRLLPKIEEAIVIKHKAKNPENLSITKEATTFLKDFPSLSPNIPALNASWAMIEGKMRLKKRPQKKRKNNSLYFIFKSRARRVICQRKTPNRCTATKTRKQIDKRGKSALFK